MKIILETEKNKILRPASGNIPRHGWYRFTSETEPARASQPTPTEVGQFQIWCTWLKSGFGHFLAIMDRSPFENWTTSLTSARVGWEAHAGSNSLVNRYQSCLGMSPLAGRRIFENSISKIIFSRYFSFGKSKMLPKWYQMGEVMLWRVHGTLGKVPGTFWRPKIKKSSKN